MTYSTRLRNAATVAACAVAGLMMQPLSAARADDDVDPRALTIDKEVPVDAPHPPASSAVSAPTAPTSTGPTSVGSPSTGSTSTGTAATALPYGLTFAGVTASGGTNAASLRLTNRGPRAGTATVTLISAASGAVLGTWTSASIPVFAATQTALSDIAAHATPALTAADLAAPLNLRLSTTFVPSAQLIAVSAAGALTNLTACGGALLEDIDLLGYVEGPGTAGVTGAVRIVNTSSRKAVTAQLKLYSAADGTSLGTWTSPAVPANGSFTTSAAAIAAAATPVVVATTPAFTVLATPASGLRLEHVATAGGALTDLTSACSPY